jgi:hypothetical protein
MSDVDRVADEDVKYLSGRNILLGIILLGIK